jgi:hypothetical protein
MAWGKLGENYPDPALLSTSALILALVRWETGYNHQERLREWLDAVAVEIDARLPGPKKGE